MSAFAGGLCENPKPGYPGLSFSFIGSYPQQYSEQCEAVLNRARYLGFTSVTLNPTFVYDENKRELKAVIPDADLETCASRAIRMGFDLLYKPMIEPATDASVSRVDLSKVTMLENKVASRFLHESGTWRATFSIAPDDQFRKQVFAPIMSALKKNKKRIQKHRTEVRISVATELHHSIETHPRAWNDLMWNLKHNDLKKIGMNDQVEVGLDPTVFPSNWSNPKVGNMGPPILPPQCKEFSKMLWTADFFTPSVYGDITRLKGNMNSLRDRSIREIIESLESRMCYIDKKLKTRLLNADYSGRDRGRGTKRAIMGEIGYAGNNASTNQQGTVDVELSKEMLDFSIKYGFNRATLQKIANQYRGAFEKDHNRFLLQGPNWVRNLLWSARSGGKGSHGGLINLWTVGGFDLFGLSATPALTPLDAIADEYSLFKGIKNPDRIPQVDEIRGVLQAYTAERCPGWKPRLPRKKKPAKRKAAPQVEVKHCVDCQRPSVSTELPVVPMREIEQGLEHELEDQID